MFVSTNVFSYQLHFTLSHSIMNQLVSQEGKQTKPVLLHWLTVFVPMVVEIAKNATRSKQQPRDHAFSEINIKAI